MTSVGQQRRLPSLEVGSLLGVDFGSLVRSLLSRIVLPGGRVEAHEFGRDQHSSATAGGVLIGLGSARSVPDEVLQPLANLVRALVRDDGSIRGHDENPDAMPASWGLAQVLLGLLTRPVQPVRTDRVINALSTRLIALQDPTTGGWPFRQGDEPRSLFGFYPMIALVRAQALGLWPDQLGLDAINRAAAHLVETIVADRDSREEQLLALRALSIAKSRIGERLRLRADLADLRSAVMDRIIHADGAIRIDDRSVVIYSQPTWHAIVWRPLLYLAVRDAPPTAPLPARLGHEVVTSFDQSVMAWHGPSAATSPGRGVSWASALALLATHRLAEDLIRLGLSVGEWRQRVRELQSGTYDFDVAISFAGADRHVAVEIRDRLTEAGYRVFYDRDYQHVLLGEDLAQYLQDTYFRRSRFVVAIISRAFVESKWAGNWEWRAVLARMHAQKGVYLLPYILEDVTLAGLNPTIGYVAGQEFSPAKFAELVIRKLRLESQGVG